MADKQISIVHPEKGEGAVGPELLREAISKGWKLAGDVDIAHPDKGAGVMGPGQEDLLSAAFGKGWSVAGDEPAAAPTVPDEPPPESISTAYDMRADVAEPARDFVPPEVQPDSSAIAAAMASEAPPTDDQLAIAAAEQGQHAGPRSFVDIDTALADPERLDRERVAREQQEAAEAERQRRYGAEHSATTAAAAVGEALGRVPTLGLDAPQIALQAAGDWVGHRVPVPDSTTWEAVTASPFDPSGQPLVDLGPGDGRLAKLDEQRDEQPLVDARFSAGGGDAETAPAPTYAELFDAAKEGVAGRREANPMLSGGVELAGNVGLALASGGSSLAARGGATGLITRIAAKTPTGTLARKAAQAGIWAGAKVAAKAEAPGLAGSLARIAAPAVALGTEGAVGGAVAGAVQEANQAWLANDYDSVWDLASAAGWGLLKGGAIGLGLGTVIGAGKGLLAERGGAEAGKQALREGGLVPEDLTQMADDLPVPPEEASMAYPKPESSGGLAQRALKLTPEQSKKLRDGTYGRVRDKFNRFVRLDDELAETLDISAKRQYAVSNGSEVAPTDFHTVREELGFDTGYFKRLMSDPAIAADQSSMRILRRLDKQLEGLEKKQFEAASGGFEDVKIPAWNTDEMSVLPSSAARRAKPLSEGAVYMDVDQMKRFVQRARADANDQNLGLLYDELAPVDETLVDYLQSDVAWSPKLAEINRITNPTWAKSITAKSDGQLSGFTLRKGEKLDANAYEYQRQVNDGWLDGHMSRVGVPQEEQRALAMQRMLNAASDDALTRARVYGSKEMRKAADEMVKLRREIEADLGQITQWNTNTEAAGETAKNLGVLAQVPGAAWAVESAANKARERAYKSTVDSIDAIDKAAAMRGLFRAASPNRTLNVALKSAPMAAENLPEVAGYIERMVAGGPEQMDDEDKSIAELERVFGPEMAAVHSAKMEAQRQFLLARAGNPDSPADRAKLYRYGDAALRPLKAIDRVAAGVGTAEDREAVQALYPALWKRFVDGAIRTMNKRERTYDDRLKASRALGLPVDASLQPQNLSALQQLANTAAGPEAQGAMLSPSQTRPPDMASIQGR
jgi:hypothetical protein